MNGNNLWIFLELITGSQGGFKKRSLEVKVSSSFYNTISGDSLGQDKNNLDKRCERFTVFLFVEIKWK